MCSLPKRRAKSLCCSMLSFWSRKKITRRSMSASCTSWNCWLPSGLDRSTPRFPRRCSGWNCVLRWSDTPCCFFLEWLNARLIDQVPVTKPVVNFGLFDSGRVDEGRVGANLGFDMRIELGRGHDHRLEAKRRKLVLHVGCPESFQRFAMKRLDDMARRPGRDK